MQQQQQQLKPVKSWYPEPVLTKEQENYVTMIEKVFRFHTADGRWQFVKLAPHQKEFHSRDLAILGHNAISEIVEKSRNTSFTVSGAVRMLTANYSFRDEVVPFIRLNEDKVKELLRQIGDISRHIRPIRLENGDFWPFNPKKVIQKSLSLEFPDRHVIFTGYPASTTAAESIRGLRITRGFNDEVSFEKDFMKIHIAARDANRGVVDGRQYYQFTLGSTLKDFFSPFVLWLNKMKPLISDNKITNWRVTSWPVFDPQVFNKERSPLEQPNLIPIVPWHDIENLNQKYLEDPKTFLEEYMCILTPSDETFYPVQQMVNSDYGVIDETLKNSISPVRRYGSSFTIGVDPAGQGQDFFAVVIFEENQQQQYPGIFIQRYLYYQKNSDLRQMKHYVSKLIRMWKPIKCRIDANAIGYQLGEDLRKEHSCVEIIRGKVNVKISNRQTVPIKEYLHTNLKSLIVNKKVRLLDDPMQIQHFRAWDYNFQAEHTSEYGHGDTTIANALALLPMNWRFGGREMRMPPTKEEKDLTEKDVEELVAEFQNADIKTKMEFYKNQR